MGLDSVELVMAWEAQFGIEIPDADVLALTTPRAATDYIYHRLSHADPVACITQRSFYRVRQAAMDVLDLGKQGLVPATRLDPFVPERGRREVWKRLAVATGVPTWPQLVAPSWVTVTQAVLPFAAVVAAFMYDVTDLWVLAAFGVAALALGHVASLPLRTEIAGEWPTLGGIARYVATRYPNAVLGPEPSWSREQVRALVRTTISEELGISPDFDDNAEFVKDLGVS